MSETLMKVTNNSVSEKTYDLNSIPERIWRVCFIMKMQL
jgi:hypothetical protein